jgi:hypothetical protein
LKSKIIYQTIGFFNNEINAQDGIPPIRYPSTQSCKMMAEKEKKNL